DGGAGRDEGDPQALGAGLVGRRGGGVAQVGVVGQQDDLAGPGTACGLHELPARGRLPGAGEHRGRARLGVQPGQALARDDGHDGPPGTLGEGGASGAGGVDVGGTEVGDPDPVGPPGLDPGLDGGPGVVDVDVDVPQPVAADHDEG